MKIKPTSASKHIQLHKENATARNEKSLPVVAVGEGGRIDKGFIEGTEPCIASTWELWSTYFCMRGLRLEIWEPSQPFKQLVDGSARRQTHKSIGVVKCHKCQESVSSEQRAEPTERGIYVEVMTTRRSSKIRWHLRCSVKGKQFASGQRQWTTSSPSRTGTCEAE